MYSGVFPRIRIRQNTPNRHPSHGAVDAPDVSMYSTGMSERRPRPYESTNVAAYLADMVEHLRAVNPRFSYRWFSKEAGFSSPNVLQLAAQGKRNVSLASVSKFAKGLGLDDREAEAFELLVHLDRAGDEGERARLLIQLKQCAERDAAGVDDQQYDAYAPQNWFWIPLREMVPLEGFREDPDWIAARLNPQVPAPAVRDAIEGLLRLGFLERDNDGHLFQSDPHITTGSVARKRQAVRSWHKKMLELGARALDAFPVAHPPASVPEAWKGPHFIGPPDQPAAPRTMTAMTLRLNARELREAVALFAQMRARLRELEGTDGHEAEREVYHFMFLGFPVTAALNTGDERE